MSAYVSACDALFRLTGEGCCTSCAEDASMGEPICEIESPPPKHRSHAVGRFYSEVCCTHANMEPEDNENRRAWWAVLLRAGRSGRTRP